MPAFTVGFALGLIVLGLVTYFATGQASVTSLIPAFFGAALALCGLLALRARLRKHAMHAAAAVALLGAVGALARAVPGLGADGPLRWATVSQLVMGVGLLVYVALAVRSFVRARSRASG